MAQQYFANNATTLLESSLSLGATQIAVVDATAFPDLGVNFANNYFLATIKQDTHIEIVKVIDRSGNLFTNVVRGQEGTSTFAFSAGATISLNVTAQTLRDLQAGINSALNMVDAILLDENDNILTDGNKILTG